MITLLLLAFLSGFVTIFAPCIWPILPIVLSAGVSGGRRKPLGLVTGLSVSFIFFTLALTSLVRIFAFDPEILRYLAVVIIGFLGVVLLVPWFGGRLEAVVSRLGTFGSRFTRGRGDGFGGGFITGAALGLIWTPCAGPILAAVATLAATQAVGVEAILLITAYVVGVAIPLYFLTLLGGQTLSHTRALSPYTGVIQQAFGAVMIVSAMLIFTGYDKKLQTFILETFPNYGSFLYVFEEQADKTGQLEALRTGKDPGVNVQSEILESMFEPELKDLGVAPELTGITGWLNSEPLTIAQLQGKVVLIDFWTYSCINCIRTLPFVTGWYEKYKDDGFVVIGVHTPEFAFEHESKNVAQAIKKYNITYPVAQDNNYATWKAYNNRYWPAHYLIDQKGHVRRIHFGEGAYDETEEAIRTLLEEGGVKLSSQVERATNEEKVARERTEETYLGSMRGEKLASLESVTGGEQVFSLPNTLNEGEYALSGSAQVADEYIRIEQSSELHLRFLGSKVFLVMKPSVTGKESRVTVWLDGKPLTLQESGQDVIQSQVRVDEERLYELIDFRGQPREGRLQLFFEEGEVDVFAFTFA